VIVDDGTELTVTVVVLVPLQPFESVVMTVYVPLAAVVAEPIEGFFVEELKLFGPLHA
jgi:hypothetical protein